MLPAPASSDASMPAGTVQEARHPILMTPICERERRHRHCRKIPAMTAIPRKPLRPFSRSHLLHRSARYASGGIMTGSVPKDGNAMHVMRDPLCIRAWTARRPAIILRILGVLLLSASASEAGAAAAQPCEGNNGGITLPPGFCATVFADNVGHARQMVVAPNGMVYVNTWSGPYYRNDTPPPGG